jgi:hypothetical protein
MIDLLKVVSHLTRGDIAYDIKKDGAQPSYFSI